MGIFNSYTAARKRRGWQQMAYLPCITEYIFVLTHTSILWHCHHFWHFNTNVHMCEFDNTMNKNHRYVYIECSSSAYILLFYLFEITVYLHFYYFFFVSILIFMIQNILSLDAVSRLFFLLQNCAFFLSW